MKRYYQKILLKYVTYIIYTIKLTEWGRWGRAGNVARKLKVRFLLFHKKSSNNPVLRKHSKRLKLVFKIRKNNH